MPRRLKLPIYFKSREKCFLHPSRDANMTLVRKQPNKRNLKHLPPRKTCQQKNIQQPSTTTEVDPKMPPLEDIRPKKKFRFKDPDSKHFPQ